MYVCVRVRVYVLACVSLVVGIPHFPLPTPTTLSRKGGGSTTSSRHGRQSSHRSLSLSLSLSVDPLLCTFLRVGQTVIRNLLPTRSRRLVDFVCSRLFRAWGKKANNHHPINPKEFVDSLLVTSAAASSVSVKLKHPNQIPSFHRQVLHYPSGSEKPKKFFF